MRENPDSTISKSAWELFNQLCEEEGVGEHEDDWLPWYKFFREGYEKGVTDP